MIKSLAFGLAALSSISTVSAQLGIAYGAVLNDGSTCKTQDQVNQDFSTIVANDNYATVRLYGTNCIAPVLTAAMANNMKLFIGTSNTLSNTPNEIQAIIDAVGSNWGSIDTVAIGNEGFVPNPPDYTLDDLSSAIQQSRSTLSGAGYNGDVTTVDQFYNFLNIDGLCTVGSYVAINVYAFFDTPNGQDVSNAASFVQTQAGNVQSHCGADARVVITESGWPSAGSANGASVPSPANQAQAIQELKAAYSSGLYLFEAFNEYWKPAGDLGVEQYWGFLGDSAAAPAPSKRSIQRERRSKA